MLACVPGERGRPPELGLGLREASKLAEQVSPDTRQKVVRLERGLAGELLNDRESSGCSLRHPNGNGAVQLHDRRVHDFRECLVERGYLRPIRIAGFTGAGVAGSDSGLQA